VGGGALNVILMSETAEPIRVLNVLARMQPGGAETRLVEIMGRLRPREFRVDVCAHSGQAGALDAAVRGCGGDVIPLRLDARFPGRFVGLLRRGRYHVVHSHVLHTSGAILALAAVAGVPKRIAHFRVTTDGRRSTLRRRAYRRAMCELIDRYATDIVGCGEGAMDAVWRAGWRTDPRCRIIYNTVDLTRFEQMADRDRMRSDLGIPTGAEVFIHLGREAPDDQKNHRRLLNIFAELRKAVASAWLVLAGAGTDDAAGETAGAVRDLGLQDRVVALGVRNDVPRLLKSADALLLPSRWEGLPGAVLEACAAGVPVLASDLPGVREIAARLSLVRYLPLTASDAEWAKAAACLPAEAKRLALKETSADAFRASVFHVDRAVEAYRTLWGRPVERRECACS
jgi:glycosyltransferase involved in cell wall biosynthesis